MTKAPSTPDNSEYKERLIAAAIDIIDADGIEGLTASKLANRVGLSRTVVHYHFGTMDELLAAIIRQSFAKLRDAMRSRFRPETLGEDIWKQYTIALPTAEAFRARALASKVVGEAYREVSEDIIGFLSNMLRDAYCEKGIEPEVPTPVMALTLLVAAQFVGSSRLLGITIGVDGLEQFAKSLFSITASKDEMQINPQTRSN